MEHLLVEIWDIRLAFAMLAGLAATVLQGYAGFGGGLIFVPSLTILFGPIEGIAVATLASLAGQIQLLPPAIRQANWREVAPVLAAVFIATPLGTFFLITADPALVRFAMGGFILVCVALLMANVKYRGPRGIFPSAAVGLAAGGVTGTVGVPSGPVFAIYFLAADAPPGIQRANMVLTAWLMISMLVTGLAINGGVETHSLARAVFVIPGTLIGAGLGAYLFRLAPASWFRHVVLVLLVIAGLSVMLTGPSGG